MKLKSIVFKLILILILGGAGGILFDRALFPYLAQFQVFGKIKWISDAKNITHIINKTEQVFIKENEALENAIQRVWITVGVVLQKDKKGKILNQFSSFVLTDDGLILTSYDAAASGANLYFLTRENKELALEIQKKDKKLGLAILKASNYNFATVPLGKFDKIKLGERVFLVGAMADENAPSDSEHLTGRGNFQNFVNTGIIKSVSPDEIVLNFTEQKYASGSPLFNIKGEMIGINLVGPNGRINVAPINKIREFIKQ